jgi:hypothetical protein
MERINSVDAHGRVLHGVKDGKRVFKEAQYTDGSDSSPRTPITVSWLNDVQLEILSVIEASSITPESGKAQMIESIKSLISKNIELARSDYTDLTEANKKELSELRGFIKNELKNICKLILENKKETETLRASLNDALVALQGLLDFRDGEVASRLAVEEEKKRQEEARKRKEKEEEEEARRLDKVDRMLDRR